jgi:hypothetical protein
MLPAPCPTLTKRDRWLVYFVLAALPGLTVQAWFGFAWAMIFEVFVWVPQQHLFDALKLAETLPYQVPPSA